MFNITKRGKGICYLKGPDVRNFWLSKQGNIELGVACYFSAACLALSIFGSWGIAYDCCCCSSSSRRWRAGAITVSGRLLQCRATSVGASTPQERTTISSYAYALFCGKLTGFSDASLQLGEATYDNMYFTICKGDYCNRSATSSLFGI